MRGSGAYSDVQHNLVARQTASCGRAGRVLIIMLEVDYEIATFHGREGHWRSNISLCTASGAGTHGTFGLSLNFQNRKPVTAVIIAE